MWNEAARVSRSGTPSAVRTSWPATATTRWRTSTLTTVVRRRQRRYAPGFSTWVKRPLRYSRPRSYSNTTTRRQSRTTTPTAAAASTTPPATRYAMPVRLLPQTTACHPPPGGHAPNGGGPEPARPPARRVTAGLPEDELMGLEPTGLQPDGKADAQDRAGDAHPTALL